MMGHAVLTCIRSEVRNRWRSLGALALLVALASAVVVTAAGGARRTASALDRLSELTVARDLSVQVDRPEIESTVLEGIESLPEVEAAGRLTMYPVLPDPSQVRASELDLAVFASPDGGWGRDVDRGLVIAGRHPDPAETYEVAINEVAVSETGLGVGDTLDIQTFTPADLEFVFSGQGFQGFNGPKVTLEVVGVVRRADDLQGSAAEVGPVMVGTQAFARRHADDMGGLTGMVGLRLADESAVQAVRARVAELAGPEGGVFVSTSREDFGDSVRSALDVLATSLWAFAGVAAVAGLVVVGGTVSRLAAAGVTSPAALAALGMDRTGRTTVVAYPLVIAVAAGGTVGSLLAVAGSSLMPVGFARQVEPSLGVDIDVSALVTGWTITVALGALGAWGAARRGRVGETLGARRLRRASWLTRLATPPAAWVGLRQLTESSHRSVPMRSAFVAALLAVGGVVGAATIVSSLDSLVDEPVRYGWSWSSEPDALDEGHVAVARRLAEEPDVESVAVAVTASVEIGGMESQASAVEQISGSVAPVIRDGRQPRTDGEVALGARTARALDVVIGDTVEATTTDGRATVPLEVVGIAVLRPVDNPHPGEGALLDPEGLELVRRSDGFEQVLVRYRQGVDIAALEADLAERHPIGFSAYSYPRAPGSIVNLHRTTDLTVALGVFFAAIGMAGVAHALVVSVRRRRREFAVLAALGFVRFQLRWAVMWQGIALAVVGLVLGVPLGLAGGRLVWRVMVGDLGVLDAPTQPVTVLLVMLPAAAAAAIVVASGPGRWVTRLRPGSALRAD